jgi:hypothetical protein
VIDEGAAAVDLDDGQPLAIDGLERGIARDLDLRQLEAELAPRVLDDRPGAVAEVAAGGVVEANCGCYG